MAITVRTALTSPLTIGIPLVQRPRKVPEAEDKSIKIMNRAVLPIRATA